jgi:S1-C subfamily serine protease
MSIQSSASSESPQGADPIADAVERIAASTVALRASRRGTASGTLWRNGVVVTAAHAVHPERPVELLGPNQTEMQATVVGVDHATDVAVLRCENELVASVEPAGSGSIRTGSFVFAVARDGSGLHSASFGYVGMSGGAWQTWRGGLIDRLIRLDGGLYPGASGGPMGTPAGQLFGIASSALSRGFGVVIPSETVHRVVDELLAHGRVVRGYLGIVTQPARLVESVTASLHITGSTGLLVTSIGTGSPAQKSALLVGDTLVEVAGIRVEQNEDLQRALLGRRAGTKAHARLIRGGQLLELELEFGERPARRCC